MQNALLRQEDWSWAGLLEEFCALGGAVQNIALAKGPFGRGLFAINPAEPVLLRVPRALVFRVEDIAFTEEKIGFRQSADVSESGRRFFERYARAFSWGAEGKSESIAFVTALDALPADIRELLTAEFGFADLLQGDFAERIQNHFLRSREIPWGGRRVIAPLLELANHGTEGLRYERGTNVQIQGYVRSEIILRYGAEDACSIFCRFGAVERQLAAFSLSMRVRFEDREIVIRRNISESVRRGADRVPKTSIEDRKVALSHLMLGHRKFPGLPRGTFRALLREAGMTRDEVFDDILRFNALKFIKLLQVLEPHESEMVAKLRTMARYQLEAMSYCIGSRELAPAPTIPGS
jgi:hypothetical protein